VGPCEPKQPEQNAQRQCKASIAGNLLQRGCFEVDQDQLPSHNYDRYQHDRPGLDNDAPLLDRAVDRMRKLKENYNGEQRVSVFRLD